MHGWQLSGPRRPVRMQALHSRQLLLSPRPLRSRRRLSARLLLSAGRLLPVLHPVPRRPTAAAVRPAQLRRVSRWRLLLDHRPVCSFRKLLSRLLLHRQRRVPVLHRLPLRQLLSAACDASADAVPRGKLLSLLKPLCSHAVHRGQVLCSHGPDGSVGQLRRRLLQQRRRCDGGVHDVPGGAVPGHSRPGVLQGMPFGCVL